ncbi:MAG: hypothetical protein HYY86_00065 [Candidatus Harrisonbacteria bacterium]|nr:hypothetical protein [Candidatus Harrisonbacteria bacterium]
MSFRTSLILFVIFMLFGTGAYFAVQNGWYPIALVNFDILTKKSVEKDSAAAFRYFQNALLASGSDPRQLEKPESRKEIRRAVLDKLIVDSLIYQELQSKFPNEFRDIAEKNINQFVQNNNNVEQGAKLLYGLEWPDFKERILLPQAYREILEGRMFLNNENFSDWLVQKRGLARVIIFTPDLQWEDNGVKLR